MKELYYWSSSEEEVKKLLVHKERWEKVEENFDLENPGNPTEIVMYCKMDKRTDIREPGFEDNGEDGLEKFA